MLGGKTGATQSDYEGYVLALLWLPQWGYRACPAGRFPNPALVAAMDGLGPDSMPFNALSMHGLWPEYAPGSNHSGYGWPQYCNRNSCEETDGIKGLCGKSFNYSACLLNASLTPCQTSSNARRQFNVSDRWHQWGMGYAYSDLATHEWAKHGSCTPFSQVDYYSELEYAYDLIRAGDGASVVRLAAEQNNISANALRLSFAADTGAPAVLQCEQECQLSEVWLGARMAAHTFRPLLSHGHGVPLITSNDTCADCDVVYLQPWIGCPVPPTMSPTMSPTISPTMSLAMPNLAPIAHAGKSSLYVVLGISAFFLACLVAGGAYVLTRKTCQQYLRSSNWRCFDESSEPSSTSNISALGKATMAEEAPCPPVDGIRESGRRHQEVFGVSEEEG